MPCICPHCQKEHLSQEELDGKAKGTADEVSLETEAAPSANMKRRTRKVETSEAAF